MLLTWNVFDHSIRSLMVCISLISMKSCLPSSSKARMSCLNSGMFSWIVMEDPTPEMGCKKICSWTQYNFKVTQQGWKICKKGCVRNLAPLYLLFFHCFGRFGRFGHFCVNVGSGISETLSFGKILELWYFSFSLYFKNSLTFGRQFKFGGKKTVILKPNLVKKASWHFAKV